MCAVCVCMSVYAHLCVVYICKYGVVYMYVCGVCRGLGHAYVCMSTFVCVVWYVHGMCVYVCMYVCMV